MGREGAQPILSLLILFWRGGVDDEGEWNSGCGEVQVWEV